MSLCHQCRFYVLPICTVHGLRTDIQTKTNQHAEILCRTRWISPGNFFSRNHIWLIARANKSKWMRGNILINWTSNVFPRFHLLYTISLWLLKYSNIFGCKLSNSLGKHWMKIRRANSNNLPVAKKLGLRKSFDFPAARPIEDLRVIESILETDLLWNNKSNGGFRNGKIIPVDCKCLLW